MNPVTESGVRLFKHHQFLTLLGESEFHSLIQNSIDLMSRCQNWNQFIKEFSKKYGKAYQLDLFDDIMENGE